MLNFLVFEILLVALDLDAQFSRFRNGCSSLQTCLCWSFTSFLFLTHASNLNFAFALLHLHPCIFLINSRTETNFTVNCVLSTDLLELFDPSRWFGYNKTTNQYGSQVIPHIFGNFMNNWLIWSKPFQSDF